MAAPGTTVKSLGRACESARASAASCHAVAGLGAALVSRVSGPMASPLVREAVRLMRHAEASARAAATLFAEVESTLRAQAKESAGVAPDSAGAAAPSKSAARRARRKAGKNKSPAPMDATSVAPPGVSDGPAVAPAPGRVLQAKTSRERSPRREEVSAVGTGSVSGTFRVGDSVVAADLSAQPELNGNIGKITGFDTVSQRYMVKFASAGAPVKLKAENLRQSIFTAT